MKPLKTITISQILALFEKYLGWRISRSQLYYYLKTDGFPQPLPLRTRPRRWRNDRVRKWIERRIKESAR